MKVSAVLMTMKDQELAQKIAQKRLRNPEDRQITEAHHAAKFQGASFFESETCQDLHYMCRDGQHIINFIESGERVSYHYNCDDYARVKTLQEV